MKLNVTSPSKYFLLVIALQLVLGQPCTGECPINVWDCNSHVFRATSDQELFPFLKSASEAFQPPLAPGDSVEGQQSPRHSSENYDNPGFYDPNYGFSKESIADLITKDKDSFSKEPILIEAVPPVGNIYSNAYQNNFEPLEEGKGFKNILRVDPANDDSNKKFVPIHEIPYKNPVTFVDALIRQMQQVNKSINYEKSQRSLSSIDSADYTSRFRNNFNEYPNLPINSVNKYEDEHLKSRQFQGNRYGEDVRGIATKSEPYAPQYQSYGKDALPNKNRDISDLLEQSRALNAYLNKLQAKAEADLLRKTKNSGSDQRGGSGAFSRGGRAIHRGRQPQLRFAHP